ncbi:hypothetical protein RM780_00410 [Streptomyces sp. DSM 44917]|uniref:Uncharacterized protein n=1 Tax=Streptomyces boetiae TaxID=3075541 RepID=A0ABU2L264_9ACTN|nr:hypothetical protein [Streptomyces sp. DSM 44917]MDT0305428.1 hypothetical protein [Streptomyces sp. DSM 44917]
MSAPPDLPPNRHPAAVYRLLPSLLDEGLTLRLDDLALRAIGRWQMTGSPADRPTAVTARWRDGSGEPKSPFPSAYTGAPVLRRDLADLLGPGLTAAGDLLPVDTGDPADDYVLLLVTEIADCLDQRRSSKPRRATGEIKQSVFLPDALPTTLAAFRVPQFPTGVYWNAWSTHRLTDHLGPTLEPRLCWSEDPALKPHPDPWGF